MEIGHLMCGILSDDTIDSFPVINTYTGLVDKIRESISTNTLYSVDEIGECGICERYDFIREFGYVIPTSELIDAIKSLGRKWVSIGCGRGYLERILLLNGIDVIATDIVPVNRNPYFMGSGYHEPYTPIEVIDGFWATKKYHDRSVILSWIPADAMWGIEVVKSLGDNLFLFIGERHNGCTGHNLFHDYIDANYSHVMSIPHAKFIGINDAINVYKLAQRI